MLCAAGSRCPSCNQLAVAAASPKTRKLTDDDKAMIAAARDARARGTSIEAAVFGAIQGKGAQGAYLNAHLRARSR